MAFIYCKHCDWGQDDFYDWRIWKKYAYNPVSRLRTAFSWLIAPRSIGMDLHFFEDSGVLFRVHRDKEGFNKYKTHSWRILLYEIKRIIRSWRNMRWQNYDKWKRDYRLGVAKCPDCGAQSWEID